MKIITGTLAIALMAIVALATAPSHAAQEVGTVDRVQNIVLGQHGEHRRELAAGNGLFFEELLRSQADARLGATLADDTRITLGENAVLRIDEFVFTPGQRGGTLAMRVLQGAFLFVGGEVETPAGGNVTIQTPVGTLGIRGTTVWGGPLDGRYGIIVLEGEVTLTNAAGTVTLTEGLGTMVASAQSAPEAPAPWADDRMARAVATITFAE